VPCSSVMMSRIGPATNGKAMRMPPTRHPQRRPTRVAPITSARRQRHLQEQHDHLARLTEHASTGAGGHGARGDVAPTASARSVSTGTAPTPRRRPCTAGREAARSIEIDRNPNRLFPIAWLCRSAFRPVGVTGTSVGNHGERDLTDALPCNDQKRWFHPPSRQR
jgi:hypothetical protein